MKRYVISPVVGAGTENNRYRASVSGLPQTNDKSIVPTIAEGLPGEGTPKYRFALSHIGTLNLSAVLTISNSFVFPDYPLDARLDGMESITRAAMLQSVTAFDWDGNGFHLNTSVGADDTRSYRDFILSLAQQLEPAYTNLNTFDAAEPK